MQEPTATGQFTPVRSLRLSEEIIKQIARLIEDGSLHLDDRFPSERDLQERWQVSRPVLREAFRVLEMQGVVESRPGAGRYLRSNRIPDPIQARRHRLRQDRGHLLEVWDIREALEGKAAELAAKRATAAEIANIEQSLHVLDDASIVDLRRFDLNREFHMSIAKASGNPRLQELIADVLRESNQIGFKEVLDDEDFSDLDGRHQKIFDAIVAGDPEAARKAMVSHFDRMRKSRAVS